LDHCQAFVVVGRLTMGRYVINTVSRLSFLIFVLCEVLHAEQYYTNQWAVHVEGGEHVARRLADRHGFTYVDTVRLLLLCLFHAVYFVLKAVL